MFRSFPIRRFSAAAAVLTSALLAAAFPIPPSEGEVIPFGPERWNLAEAKVFDHLGRRALMGTALLKDVVFEDGTIECDIAMKAGVRSYPGVLFRLQSGEEYERLYLRPHRAPLYGDAVQYLPAFHGVDAWQIYSGPGITSAAMIPTDRWVHVKIEVLGTQARVFLDNTPEPVLVVGDLKRGKSRGGLGLSTTADGNSCFSNFSFRSDAPLGFPPPPLVDETPGCVRNWELSRPFKRLRIDFDAYPDLKAPGLAPWTKAAAQPDGILDISRTHGRQGTEPDGILARAVVCAEADGPKKFWFGYSDEAGLFVNGRPVFYGNSSYRYRDSSFLGVVGLYDAVTVPLKKGDNELLIVLGEASGGWGFIVQDAAFVYRAPGIEALWSTGREFLVPESAAYDPATDAFYVSNYDGYNPSRGTERQFISKLTAGGEVAALQWVAGLNNPTGLAVRKGRLFAVERAGVVEIDIASARIAGRTPVPGAAFLNDLAIADNGDIYVSDSRKNGVYKISGGRVEEWLFGPAITAPNGICVLGGKLIVGTNGDGCLKSADLATKEISILVNLGPGIIDGLVPDGDGRLLVSHNEGRLFRVSPEGRALKILDTTALRMNMADFAYEPGLGIVVFPTFTDGRAAAFRLGR